MGIFGKIGDWLNKENQDVNAQIQAFQNHEVKKVVEMLENSRYLRQKHPNFILSDDISRALSAAFKACNAKSSDEKNKVLRDCLNQTGYSEEEKETVFEELKNRPR